METKFRVVIASVFLGVFYVSRFVDSAAAPELSSGPDYRGNEYTTAYINLTYVINGKLHTEKSETGKFLLGQEIMPASGIVVPVISALNANLSTLSHNGCDYPFLNLLPNEPWIALIKGGTCSYDVKLKNAWKSNASAMVVYNDRDGKDLDKLTVIKCAECDISGVLTRKSKGEEIANLTEQGIKVNMYITVGETKSFPYNGINRTSVLFVSISFIVLMIISLAWLVFYYVQRFRYLHAKDRLAQRLCNAAKKALAKIPIRNVKNTDKEIIGEGETCAVCIEVYRSGDILRTLPCRHEFHKGCVDPWLLEHRTCPMCKMDILKYYGFIVRFTGSQESILHFEDGAMNSSESRETESPTHEHHGNQPTAQLEEIPNSSHSTAFVSGPDQNGSIRKASLISLKMVTGKRANLCPECSSSDECSICDNLSVKSDKKKSKSFENPSSLLQDQHPMCRNSMSVDLPQRAPSKSTNYVVVSEKCSVHQLKNGCQNENNQRKMADEDTEDEDLKQEVVALVSNSNISDSGSESKLDSRDMTSEGTSSIKSTEIPPTSTLNKTT